MQEFNTIYTGSSRRTDIVHKIEFTIICIQVSAKLYFTYPFCKSVDWACERTTMPHFTFVDQVDLLWPLDIP